MPHRGPLAICCFNARHQRRRLPLLLPLSHHQLSCCRCAAGLPAKGSPAQVVGCALHERVAQVGADAEGHQHKVGASQEFLQHWSKRQVGTAEPVLEWRQHRVGAAQELLQGSSRQVGTAEPGKQQAGVEAAPRRGTTELRQAGGRVGVRAVQGCGQASEAEVVTALARYGPATSIPAGGQPALAL